MKKLLFVLLCLLSFNVFAESCRGVVVGASNSTHGKFDYAIPDDQQHKLVDALGTLSALPGFRCKWFSYGEPGIVAPWDQIRQAVNDLGEFDVLVVGHTGLLLRYPSGVQFAQDLASVCIDTNVCYTPHIVILKYPPFDTFIWNGQTTTPERNIAEFNNVVDIWSTIGVEYPKYIAAEDGLHAAEKTTYGMAARIYAALIANGF